jgi:hypothetical protein
MSLSILYCRECDTILAAAPGLDLVVECVSHTAGGVPHRGSVALRLPDVNLATEALDLTELTVQYPKSTHGSSLEAVGNCNCT